MKQKRAARKRVRRTARITGVRKRSTRSGSRMSCTKTSRMIFRLKWTIR